jgi:spore coat protein H
VRRSVAEEQGGQPCVLSPKPVNCDFNLHPLILRLSIRTCVLLFFAIPIISCVEEEGLKDADFEATDWTEPTHGKIESPDYSTVFDQEKVKALHIKMTTEDWGHIQSDMKTRTGSEFGSGVRPNQGNGPLDLVSGDPDYVALSVTFEGTNWYKVGFRLKGNSTLASSWRNGVYKLPFRLNFDKFEDDYPQIKNQRFYGFQELSFSPAAKDNSLIREKIGADIMNAAGVPAAMTSFYQVFIDFGSGEQYCGVYTMVEVIDDTMIPRAFGSADGNIYKPESR